MTQLEFNGLTDEQLIRLGEGLAQAIMRAHEYGRR